MADPAIIVGMASGLLSGIVSGMITIVTLHTDVKWIKNILTEHGQRILRIETKENRK